MRLKDATTRTRVQGRDAAAAAQDRAQGHDGRARPGHATRRSCPRTARSRSARRCPTSTSTRSCRALDSTRATTCSSCSTPAARACSGNGDDLGARSGPSSRPPRSCARSTRLWPRGGATSRRAIHNFSLLAEELGDKDDSSRASSTARTRSSHPRRPGASILRATLRELPSALLGHAGGARQDRPASRRARAGAPRAAPGRPRARPDPARRHGRSCARRRRSSATRSARFVRERAAVRHELRPAMRDLAAAHAGPR